MLNFTFKDLDALEGVKSATSDNEKNPMRDSDLTIFLKNGYRVISKISALGQTLELSPFKEKLIESFAPSFTAQIYNPTPFYQKPDDQFFKIVDENETPIEMGSFMEELEKIIGQQVKDFLQLRHESLNFSVTPTQRRQYRF